ncbi:MAG: hypothetical protein U0031_15010 [Thermomicrobiales bacterium]
MLLNAAITTTAECLLAARNTLLLGLLVASFAGSLSWFAREIASPDGAFGPAPRFPDAGAPALVIAAADGAARAEPNRTDVGSLPLTAAASGERPRPREILAGDTAEVRQSRRVDTDVRSWFIVSAMSIRNPGQGALVTPMRPLRGRTALFPS